MISIGSCVRDIVEDLRLLSEWVHRAFNLKSCHDNVCTINNRAFSLHLWIYSMDLFISMATYLSPEVESPTEGT